jgi:hypothetical protein
MGWAMMPFFGWGGYDVEPFGISCTLAWTHTDQSTSFSLCFILFFIQYFFFSITRHVWLHDYATTKVSACGLQTKKKIFS